MSYEYLVDIFDSAEAKTDEKGRTAQYYVLKTNESQRAETIREEWAQQRLKHRRLAVPEWTFWPWMAAPSVDLTVLPDYTLFLQFRFRLSGAYLSKDELAFFIIDNPLRRDKLSDLPCVAPTAWKGSLRAALSKLHYEATHPAVQRLLGNAKGEQEEFAAGRLHFFPSFFTEQSVEIINPHDRERKVGKNPILMESVPAGADSVFSLLYFPLLQWKNKGEVELLLTIAEDWEVLAEGLLPLFCTYGFGAKTNSGHGTAHEKLVADRHKKRDQPPAGKIIGNFVPDGEPAAVKRFVTEFGPLDDWTAAEWQELLAPQDFVKYQDALAALEQRGHIKAVGRAECELENLTDIQPALQRWAAEVRTLAAAKGGRHA